LLEDNSNEFKQYMVQIKGKKWIQKFIEGESVAAETAKTSANVSIGALAAIGLVNTVGVIWLWF